MVRVGVVLVGVLGVGACDPELVSERGDFALGFPELRVRAPGEWPAPRRIAVGSRVCPVLRCAACPEGQVCDGAAISASGPVAEDGVGCFVIEGPGEVVWTVAAPCGRADAGPDRAVVTAVALAELEAVAVAGLDRLVIDHAGATTAGAAWSADVPMPLRVVEGAQVRVEVELRGADDGMVAYSGGAVEWVTTAGRAPVTYPGPAVELVGFAGGAAEASFVLGDRRWAIGPVLAVDSRAAATIELAAAIEPTLGSGLARAVVRDGGGATLRGLPVTWSVDGEVALAANFPDQDYVSFTDTCLPPERRGGPRTARLRAEHGDLAAALTLRWDGVAGEPDPAWTPDAACDAGGCGCASDRGGGWPALLIAGALLLRRRRRNLSLGTLCALAIAPGCADPPALRVAASRELGALAWDPRIHGRDGGYSTRVGDRGLWVFGDTGAVKAPDALPGFLNNTACWTADLDARDGVFPLVENVQGDHPLEFLPLTPDEVAYELAHSGPDCGAACEGVALWPGPVIHDPARGRVLVFYAKLLQRPGFLDITVLGTSLAVWDDSLPPRAVRPVVAPDSAEPTLLFGADEPNFAAAAFARGGTIYAYSCDGDGFDHDCRLARAPLADPLRRASWEFFAGDDRWSAAFSDAEALFAGAPMMSVHFNDDIDAYLAVYAEPGGSDIMLRSAPAPEGPWSDAARIHRPLMPVADPFVYGALMHPEFGREGVDYLTYYLDATGTIQLVEIEWQDPR